MGATLFLVGIWGEGRGVADVWTGKGREWRGVRGKREVGGGKGQVCKGMGWFNSLCVCR